MECYEINMNPDIKTLYLCYLTEQNNKRLGIVYNFLHQYQGRRYFDIYSTDQDSIKVFLDGLRYMVKDPYVL